MEQKNKMYFPNYFECSEAIRKQKNKMPKDYKKKFSNEEQDKKLKFQQELLKSCILSKETQDFFNVFDMECSSGKTYVAVNSMPYYLLNVINGLIPKKGVLFVLRQTEECDKYVTELNNLYKDEDTGINREVAFAFHSKKYKKENGEIDKEERQKLLGKVDLFPILFITQENYINLAADEKTRKTITKNRRLLIVDESVDICEIVQVRNNVIMDKDILSLEEIEVLQEDLSEEDRPLYQSIIAPLRNKFTELKKRESIIKNTTFNFKIKHSRYNEQIDFFKRKILPKYKNNEHIFKQLEEIMDTVKLIYNDTCLINKGFENDDKEQHIEIKTINRSKQMWTLECNIIMDASASLEPKYQLNPKLYYLMSSERVLDYSKWHIEVVLGNSTKYSKGIGFKRKTPKQISRYNKFLKGCSQIITDLEIDDVFVVCHKDEHIQINNLTGKEILINPFAYWKINIPKEHIEHFGNITGKRDFGNLRNVLIAHTPNYSDTDYILQYMYYTDKRYADNITFETTSIENLGYTPMFRSQELQEFKEKTIANQIYQAICRVNREMEYEATVVIVTQYLGAVLYVRDMLNCECYINKQYDEYFEVGYNQTNEDRHDNSMQLKMRSLFDEILQGNIKDTPYIEIHSNIIKIKKEDLRHILKLDTTQFYKAKSKNGQFISKNSIICGSEYYTFILDKPINRASKI